MLCGSLDGSRVWGRMDTCICMAEFLCCLPETITTLLISLFQYKIKSKKKKINVKNTLLARQHMYTPMSDSS